MPSDQKEDRIRALELALEEQRKDYDILHSLHEGVKIKNITFLAAALALLIYLYAPIGAMGPSIQQRLFIPEQPYGVVFYVFAIFLVMMAITTLMVALVKNREWHTAYDNEQEDDLLDDYEKYLIYMRKRYLKVSKINCNCYEKRRYLLNISFIPLVLGGTILLLLKTLGG